MLICLRIIYLRNLNLKVRNSRKEMTKKTALKIILITAKDMKSNIEFEP